MLNNTCCANPLMRLNKNCFTTKFGDVLTKLGVSKHFQPAIYIVIHEESESEVQNTQILQENFKISISILFYICV